MGLGSVRRSRWLERVCVDAASLLSAHSEQIKFVTPVATFLGWLFLE